MVSSNTTLKRTPLFAEHLRLGARMVPFAGWEMPVQYKSIIQEHRSVREAAGMFDVSHMGEFRVTGPATFEFLQGLTPNDLSRTPVGGSQYSSLLRPDGGMIDDIFIYRQSDGFMVVVNASNVAKVEAWLVERSIPGATATNVSDETSLIAVQGPAAVTAVQTLTASDLSTLARRGIRSESIAGIACLAARTGYTGEDGLEIFCEPADAVTLWRALLAVNVVAIQPCGLGARDTLRLEAGNLLYGHDMDDSVNPIEAGLAWTVKLGKGDFVGRDALERVAAEGPSRRLVGFEMVDRGVPRTECLVEVGGRTIGRVTSGTYSPTLERSIGMAYVEPGLAVIGQRIDVVIRDKPAGAVIVKMPFYRSKSRSVANPNATKDSA
jgi:aminomethyltransferase